MRKTLAGLIFTLLALFPAIASAQINLSNLPPNTVVGRQGIPSQGGAAQAIPFSVLLNNLAAPCSTTSAGLVPASGGGTANFLRADCTFANPMPLLANGHILANATGATGPAQDTTPATWLDQAFCNTVGYMIARLAGGWACAQSIPVNVQWLGAACDNTTDDTTAINNAYSAASAGASIQFPNSMCKITGSITVGKSTFTYIPAGGGVNYTGTGAAFSVAANNVTISCQTGGTINGPRTPSTGNDYVAGNYGVLVNGTNGTQYSFVTVIGCNITNFKETAIRANFCNNCYFARNSLQHLSYAGILCVPCLYPVAHANYINDVSSSNGPAFNINAPTNTKTNAYGIAFTTDGSGHFSQYAVASDNVINNIPTWECLDTHAGFNIVFANNHCLNVRVGIDATTDGATTPASNVVVVGNVINCLPLGSPVYPGSSNISVGGAGINVSGVTSGNQANGIRFIGNTVVGCGSSENGTSPVGSIEAGDVNDLQISDNSIVAGRYRGILLYDQVIGAITGNNFDGLVAGPLASGNILITVTSSSCQCLLAHNFGNSSGSEGYFITAQSGGFEVGIARDNLFFGLSSLYDSGGPATNRTDLGATAP
jgi:hypothetical protein